jgi:subtilase family serine protease
MYGPTEDDYETLKAFALAHGLKVTTTHPNRMVLDVVGPSRNIEAAFHVKMNDYLRPDGTVFYGSDQEPSVDLDIPLAHVYGLNNEKRHKPKYRRPSFHQPNLGGSGTVGEFKCYDYRNAYVPGVSLTGLGQSLALVEFTVYKSTDVSTYGNSCSPTISVPLSNVYLDSVNVTTPIDCMASDNQPEIEIVLDIEMGMSMAPGLTREVVYMAGGYDPPIDVLNRIATDDSCNQISCSWGWDPDSDSSTNGSDRVEENAVLAEFASQGQSYFLASGDGNGTNGAGEFTTDPPYNDPSLGNDDELNQTVVGATNLTMSSGSWSSETTVNFSIYGWTATGGILQGTFTGDSIPFYQVGIDMSNNNGSVVYRNVPDVSIVGLDCNIYDSCYGNDDEGGTSAAAPLWAGFMALVNQQALLSSKAPVGFANPALYAIAEGANYNNDFHDITTGNNGNAAQFPAVTGYDLATGWGSPKGASLINDLVGTLPIFTPTSTPTVTYTPTITPTVSGFYLSTNNFNVLSGAPLQVTYILKNAGQVDIRAYNIQGLKIRTILSANQPAGRYFTTWDGLDEGGQPVETGLYMIVIKGPDPTQIKKVLVYRR